jgi:hypothetical protein
MNQPSFTPAGHRRSIEALRALLERRERFERANPAIAVLTPQQSGFRMWEACPPGYGRIRCHSGEQLMDTLERLYPA